MAMKSTVGKTQSNALGEIMELSLENQIKLEALEQILVKTNPMLHELYLGQIDTLRKQKAINLNRALTSAPMKS